MSIQQGQQQYIQQFLDFNSGSVDRWDNQDKIIINNKKRDRWDAPEKRDNLAD